MNRQVRRHLTLESEMAVESELHADNAHTADRSPLTGRTQISRTAEQVDGASEGIQRKSHLISPDDRVLPDCRADLDGEVQGRTAPHAGHVDAVLR